MSGRPKALSDRVPAMTCTPSDPRDADALRIQLLDHEPSLHIQHPVQPPVEFWRSSGWPFFFADFRKFKMAADSYSNYPNPRGVRRITGVVCVTRSGRPV